MTKQSPHNNTIVKRKGHIEHYDERKVYASIFSICQAVGETEPEAELIAATVVEDLQPWLTKKHEVTSHDIRVHAAKHLALYNPDAAHLYEFHRTFH